MIRMQVPDPLVLDGTEVQHVPLSMRGSEEEVNFSLHSHMIQLRLRWAGGWGGGGGAGHNGAGRDGYMKTSRTAEREGGLLDRPYTTVRDHYYM